MCLRRCRPLPFSGIFQRIFAPLFGIAEGRREPICLICYSTFRLVGLIFSFNVRLAVTLLVDRRGRLGLVQYLHIEMHKGILHSGMRLDRDQQCHKPNDFP